MHTILFLFLYFLFVFTIIIQRETSMIYYKNSPVVRSTDSFMKSKGRTLSSDEISQLISEQKVTHISEIKFERNCSRISRPERWVYYEH
jgi:hypothetical protein